MSWQITQGSTTVTLPYSPQTNTDESPTIDDSSINIPEQGTTLISVCNDVRTLTMEGFFYISGSTKSAIDNTYIIPLLSMLHQLVTLTTPRPSLNATWKFDKATFIETKDYSNQPAIKFTLVFKFASNYVVL
jgi:hypothetical protein